MQLKADGLASLVHHTEQTKKLKCDTKNKTMSMIGPVQSRCHEGSLVVRNRKLRFYASTSNEASCLNP